MSLQQKSCLKRTEAAISSFHGNSVVSGSTHPTCSAHPVTLRTCDDGIERKRTEWQVFGVLAAVPGPPLQRQNETGSFGLNLDHTTHRKPTLSTQTISCPWLHSTCLWSDFLLVLSKTAFVQGPQTTQEGQTESLVVLFCPKQVAFHKAAFRNYFNLLIEDRHHHNGPWRFPTDWLKTAPRQNWLLPKTSCGWMMFTGDNAILTYGKEVSCGKGTSEHLQAFSTTKGQKVNSKCSKPGWK